MSEHAYDPTRHGAPQMCRCGNAYRTREELKAHVRNPGPQRVRLLPAYIAPVDPKPLPTSHKWACGCGQMHQAMCPRWERRRTA